MCSKWIGKNCCFCLCLTAKDFGHSNFIEFSCKISTYPHKTFFLKFFKSSKFRRWVIYYNLCLHIFYFFTKRFIQYFFQYFQELRTHILLKTLALSFVADKWSNFDFFNFVPGIYLPVKGRFLMYSDSGVWEICRHVFQPNVTTFMMEKNATSRQDIVGLTGHYFTSKWIDPLRCRRSTT